MVSKTRIWELQATLLCFVCIEMIIPSNPTSPVQNIQTVTHTATAITLATTTAIAAAPAAADAAAVAVDVAV